MIMWLFISLAIVIKTRYVLTLNFILYRFLK